MFYTTINLFAASRPHLFTQCVRCEDRGGRWWAGAKGGVHASIEVVVIIAVVIVAVDVVCVCNYATLGHDLGVECNRTAGLEQHRHHRTAMHYTTATCVYGIAIVSAIKCTATMLTNTTLKSAIAQTSSAPVPVGPFIIQPIQAY